MPLLVGSNWILNKSEMCLRRIIRRGYVDGTSNTVVLPNSNLMQMYASIHKPYSQLNSKWKKNALPSCCSFYHYYFFSRVVFCQNYKCNCIVFPQKQTKSQFSRSKVKKNCYCEMISCNAYKMRFKINDQKDVFFVKKSILHIFAENGKKNVGRKITKRYSPTNTAVELCCGSYGQTACPDFSVSSVYVVVLIWYKWHIGRNEFVPHTSNLSLDGCTKMRM